MQMNESTLGDPRMSALAMFQAAVTAPDAPREPGRIAAGLAHAVKETCGASDLTAAEITAWGPIVTMIFSDTAEIGRAHV